MQVKVIHFDSEAKQFNPVAIVKVPAHQVGFTPGDNDALEYAFSVTQNIFGSWSKGPAFEDGKHNEDYSENVEVVGALPTYLGRTLGHRSSMVGDLFVIDGKIYICKGIGFELYEKELV